MEPDDDVREAMKAAVRFCRPGRTRPEDVLGLAYLAVTKARSLNLPPGVFGRKVRFLLIDLLRAEDGRGRVAPLQLLDAEARAVPARESGAEGADPRRRRELAGVCREVTLWWTAKQKAVVRLVVYEGLAPAAAAARLKCPTRYVLDTMAALRARANELAAGAPAGEVSSGN